MPLKTQKLGSFYCCKFIVIAYFMSLFVCLWCCSEVLGEFMEARGAGSPGILTLTTGLSKPFMRLDKYPTLLKELERHMEVRIQTRYGAPL